MQSGPGDMFESSLAIILETSSGVTDMFSNVTSVRFRKLGGEVPETEPRLLLLENILANNSALSLEEHKISGPFKRGGILDLPLFITLFIIFQKSLEPNFCCEILDLVDSMYRVLAILKILPQLFLAFL